MTTYYETQKAAGNFEIKQDGTDVFFNRKIYNEDTGEYIETETAKIMSDALQEERHGLQDRTDEIDAMLVDVLAEEQKII